MDLTGKILLDRYEVEALLGEGGMGSVYLARDTKLGRTVVVKVPLAEVLDSAQFLAEAEGGGVRSATSLSSGCHPTGGGGGGNGVWWGGFLPPPKKEPTSFDVI